MIEVQKRQLKRMRRRFIFSLTPYHGIILCLEGFQLKTTFAIVVKIMSKGFDQLKLITVLLFFDF